MTVSANYIDGNGLAGPFAEIFAVELTGASTICVGCGRHSAVAELEMFRNCFSSDRQRPLGILLVQPVPSEHLPAGTKVYYSGPIPAAAR